MEQSFQEAQKPSAVITVPDLNEKASFSATAREILAAFLMFATAHFYLDIFRSKTAFALFVAGFVFLEELLAYGRPRLKENWIWLGCMAGIYLCVLTDRCQAWGGYEYLMLHLFAVWYALTRSGKLLEGATGHLLPLDALNGLILFPFRNFFLRIRTVWYALKSLLKKGAKRSVRPSSVIWIIAAVLCGTGLFALAVKLLMEADAGFEHALSGLEGFIAALSDLVGNLNPLALPVGAYLFGLTAGSLREDPEKLRLQAEKTGNFLSSLRRVPNQVWIGLGACFCLLYLAFFAVQSQYLFGAFRGTLPEGFIVSRYARRGFFELCGVMAVNFLLIWLIVRLSSRPVRTNRASLAVCLVLLVQSLMLAATAASKIVLYIDCFGFTPLRLQSCWAVAVLAAGCVCAGWSLVSGKKSLRGWAVFSSVSAVLLCFV